MLLAIGGAIFAALGGGAVGAAHTAAAALLQSLAVNRPLVDGNKPMAWMSTVVFLDFNGTDMVDVDQEYKLVIEVASGVLEDVGDIARRLRGLREAV